MTDSLQHVEILVLGAHADDVELVVGGTIIRSVEQGRTVGIVDLTRGEMGTRGTPEIRLEESKKAFSILGASFRHQLDLGDGGLRTGRKEEDQLVEVIRRTKPRIVIGPWPEERHPDHARAGRLMTDAWFYAGLEKRQSELEPHRPDVVLYYLQNYVRHPSFVVDVTAQWEQRMKAVFAYESQFWNPDSKEPETFISKKSFIDMIEGRARHFGAMIGREFGEAFVTMQPPMINDPVEAYSGREIR